MQNGSSKAGMAAARTITLKSSINNVFLEYLKTGRPIFESYLSLKNKKDVILINRELDVLSQLLYFHHLYKDREDVWTYILTPIMREKIRLNIGISKYVLNNAVCSLRKKKVLSRVVIDDFFIPNFKEEDGVFVFLINFKLDD